MSIFFGIILLFLSGWLILKKLGVSIQPIEMLAYSLLTGIGLQSFWMLLCDVFNIQFSQPLLSVFNLGLVVILADFDAVKKFNYEQWLKTTVEKIKEQFLRPDLGSMLLLATLAGLFYLIAVKGMYWPTSEHDAIGTFDKLGVWFALEGRIHVSLYDVGLQGAGGIYPPLFPSAIAYCYLYGGNNPKILSLLFYIATLVIFFFALRRYTTLFGASFFTLILGWSPEFYSHAALLLSNIPAAAYITGASLSLFIWWKEKEQSYFTLSCIMIALSLWLRQDLIPFAAAGGLVVLWFAIQNKEWKKVFVYAAAVLIPFITWSLYVKFSLHLSAAERFGAGSVITAAKLKLVSAYLWAYLGLGQQGGSPPGYFLYGVAFLLPIVLVFANYKHLTKDWLMIPVYAFVSLVLYTLVFLLIDENLQGATLQSLMESSFKRGLFCFMPIVLFYAAASSFSVKMFGMLESYRTNSEATRDVLG